MMIEWVIPGLPSDFTYSSYAFQPLPVRAEMRVTANKHPVRADEIIFRRDVDHVEVIDDNDEYHYSHEYESKLIIFIHSITFFADNK